MQHECGGGVGGTRRHFWVENLPLTNGDNAVTVTATDAAWQCDCHEPDRF